MIKSLVEIINVLSFNVFSSSDDSRLQYQGVILICGGVFSQETTDYNAYTTPILSPNLHKFEREQI